MYCYSKLLAKEYITLNIVICKMLSNIGFITISNCQTLLFSTEKKTFSDCLAMRSCLLCSVSMEFLNDLDIVYFSLCY